MPISPVGGHQTRTIDQSFAAETSITGWSRLTRLVHPVGLGHQDLPRAEHL